MLFGWSLVTRLSLFQWFLDRMADDNWWPMQILIKCPNQIVRQVSYLSSHLFYMTLSHPNKFLSTTQHTSCFPPVLRPVDLISHRRRHEFHLRIISCQKHTVDCLCICLPDVPEVVYSRHPAAATSSRSPLPAARHGGRVRRTWLVGSAKCY